MTYNNSLIHLIAGETEEDAFQTFQEIINDGKIKGSHKWIRGGFLCICFTEKNYKFFPFEKRYKPFGFVFNKQAIYGLGAEKALYLKEEDYSILPPPLQWRFQKHNPPKVDFSWEDEVRLPLDFLDIKNNCQLLVPDQSWEEKLKEVYSQEQGIASSLVLNGLRFSILHCYK